MERLRTKDGTEIAYRDEGEGQPLVLIHGWMMSGAFWQNQLEALRVSHRVIVPDLRGCGESESKPGTHVVPQYAEDLHQLIEHLDLRRPALVGWSMGGGIVMETLARHGADNIAGVGLVDFPPRLEEDPSVADKVCHNLATRKEDFSKSFLRRMFLDPIPPATEAWMLEATRQCNPTAACEMYRAMRPTPARSPPSRLHIPALLCFPEKGWFPQSVDAWKQIFPEAVAPAFPRSKHCPFLEEPDAFNEALRGLLARAH